MKKLPTRLGWSLGLAASGVAAAMGALYGLNSATPVYLRDVIATNVSFTTASEEAVRMTNESAASRCISLDGFHVSYLARGESTPTQLTNHVSLCRADQLHLKDLYAGPMTRVQMNIESHTFSLVIDRGRASGRIGAGSRVRLSRDRSTSNAALVDLHPSWPNIKVECPAPPCSAVFELRNDDDKFFITEARVQALSFDRMAPEQAIGRVSSESSIQSGQAQVEANDIFGYPFVVRAAKLSAGATFADPTGSGALLSVDRGPGGFLVNARLRPNGSASFHMRNGEVISLVPSLLEVLLKEPWHSGVWAVGLAGLPYFMTLVRLVRRNSVKAALEGT